MSKIEKVLVIGAGVGGLGAAAALALRGIHVDVVEIKEDAKVFGVGINQPANSLRALKEIGALAEVREAGFEFDNWTFKDHHGNLIVDVPTCLGDDTVPPNCGLPRRALHEILIRAADRAGARVRYGTTADQLEERDDRVEVRFSDSVTADYDLVAAFDGINSPTRRRLFGPQHEPVYTGYGAWRVALPRPQEVTNPALFQSPHAKAGYIPLTEDHMYLLAVTEEPEGRRFEKDDLVDALRERLTEFGGLIGEIRDDLADSADVIYSPLCEVFLSPPWHRGRIVLGGDAAHACTPHITQGAAMALEDAIVLAEEVTRGAEIEAALTSFAERRYPRAKFAQDVSRGILDYEMAINEETLPAAIEEMRETLPGQFEQMAAVLNQAA